MLRILDIILLIIMGIPAWYFAFYAIAPLFKKAKETGEGKGVSRFVVVIPAYKSDSCIEATAKSALFQDYPKENFRVMVVSDSMQSDTDDKLRKIGAEVLKVEFDNSTKAKSLQAAMKALGPNAADYVVILDADNIVENNFLARLDAAFCNGAKAVQARRTAKNRDTSVAVLDAAGEEINNRIFREGHNAIGLSSALIGSGMGFDYEWFRGTIDNITTSGEDKELELQLLYENIDVQYLRDVPVYDEKTRSSSNYYGQRSRWIASQYNIFGSALKKLGSAKDGLGYFDKLFQWLFPPRMIIMVTVPVMTILTFIFRWPFRMQWLQSAVVLIAALIIAIPREMFDRKLAKALLSVPKLAAMSFANLFRIRKNKNNFIHTEHE